MAELEQRLNSLKEEFSELEDGFERYSYLMELGSYLPPYPEEKEPPTIWCGDVKVRYGSTATPKTGAFSSTQTAIHISLRVCFCSCRICSRIFRRRRPLVQIWSCYRSWGCKTSFRIPGKRVSVPLLQCSQMQQKQRANHLNHQQRKTSTCRVICTDRGTFQLHVKGMDAASVQSRT